MKLLHEPVLRRKALACERAAGTASPAAQGFKSFFFAHLAARPGYARKARAKATLRG